MTTALSPTVEINSETRISLLLKQHPDALETIINLAPKFTKLRNPVLRRLMASRTSIAMACKIGGCSLEEFFARMETLGFRADRSQNPETVESHLPSFMKQLDRLVVVELDVRPVMENGEDPFGLITNYIRQLLQSQVLKLINTFEPAPLIELLEKQGFVTHSEIKDDETVFTWFYKTSHAKDPEPEPVHADDSWDEVLEKFNGRMVVIDVQQLEMPGPMMTILEELDNLPDDHALFVYHKRIPMFLLPELKDRQLDYRAKEISESEVHMIIFKA